MRAGWWLLMVACGGRPAPMVPPPEPEPVPQPALAPPPASGLTLRFGERAVVQGVLQARAGGQVVVLTAPASLVGGGPGVPARAGELWLPEGALGADGDRVVVAGALVMVEENAYAGPALRGAAIAPASELSPVAPSMPPSAWVAAMMQGSGELLPLTPPETLGGWLRRVRGTEVLSVRCEAGAEGRFRCAAEVDASQTVRVEVERGPTGWRIAAGSATVGPT